LISQDIADKLAALGGVTRLDILWALRDKSVQCQQPDACDISDTCCNVGELADLLQLSSPTISYHLKELRRAGFVTRHQEGQQAYFVLNPAAFRPLSRFFQNFEVTYNQ